MKTAIFKYFTLCVFFTSCATINNHVPVMLYDCSDNIKVSENGSPLEVKQITVSNSKQYQYYTPGFVVKRSKEDHVITLEKDGKSVNVTLKSTFAFGTLMADLLPVPFISIPVDIAAGPLRTVKPKYIDVPFVFGEVKTARKESELKKMTITSANSKK